MDARNLIKNEVDGIFIFSVTDGKFEYEKQNCLIDEVKNALTDKNGELMIIISLKNVSFLSIPAVQTLDQIYWLSNEKMILTDITQKATDILETLDRTQIYKIMADTQKAIGVFKKQKPITQQVE